MSKTVRCFGCGSLMEHIKGSPNYIKLPKSACDPKWVKHAAKEDSDFYCFLLCKKCSRIYVEEIKND